METAQATYENAERTPRKSAMTLPLQMLIGLILGTLVGIFWPSLATQLQPLGLLFIEAIKMVIIPLVFCAVTLGVYRMGSEARNLGRVAGITAAWFMLATTVAISIALLLNVIFHPGVGTGLEPTGAVPENLATSVDLTSFQPTSSRPWPNSGCCPCWYSPCCLVWPWSASGQRRKESWASWKRCLPWFSK